MAKRQKLSEYCIGLLRKVDETTSASCDMTSMDVRKSAYEWCIAYQNALSQACGSGLERTQVTAAQLIDFTDVWNWASQHLCGDNGSDQVSGEQAISRRVRFLH